MFKIGQVHKVSQVQAVQVVTKNYGVQVVLAKAFPAVLALIPVQVKA
jgi:hypothetical protein